MDQPTHPHGNRIGVCEECGVPLDHQNNSPSEIHSLCLPCWLIHREGRLASVGFRAIVYRKYQLSNLPNPPYGDVAFINDLDSETQVTMYKLLYRTDLALFYRREFIELWNMVISSYKTMALKGYKEG